MQTLNYSETWTLFYALMLLSGLADMWSAQVRQRLGRTDVACNTFLGRDQLPTMPEFDKVLRRSITAVLILIPLSLWYLQPTIGLLWAERTKRLLDDVVSRAWPLQFTAADGPQLWQLSLATLAMSILAAALAAGGGAFLSFLAVRPSPAPPGNKQSWAGSLLRFASRTLLLLMRAIPAPIWALLFLFLFFPGMLPGALALAVYNMGILGRLMAEVTENQDERPLQAIRAIGAGSGPAFLYGTVPAVTPRYLAYGLYRWENAIRETVVVGLVGAGGLGRELTQQLAAFNYRAVLTLLICVMLLTFMVDMVSTAVRRTMR